MGPANPGPKAEERSNGYFCGHVPPPTGSRCCAAGSPAINGRCATVRGWCPPCRAYLAATSCCWMVPRWRAASMWWRSSGRKVGKWGGWWCGEEIAAATLDVYIPHPSQLGGYGKIRMFVWSIGGRNRLGSNSLTDREWPFGMGFNHAERLNPAKKRHEHATHCIPCAGTAVCQCSGADHSQWRFRGLGFHLLSDHAAELGDFNDQHPLLARKRSSNTFFGQLFRVLFRFNSQYFLY